MNSKKLKIISFIAIGFSEAWVWTGITILLIVQEPSEWILVIVLCLLQGVTFHYATKWDNYLKEQTND